MKRKADHDETPEANGKGKRRATESNDSVQNLFRRGLFASDAASRFTDEYRNSSPYKHAVVSELIRDDLLRSVRTEILDNIHFTPKETDIYKIHQSGDLANLDGLPASALKKLPSLLKLRDALYSHDFRKWVSSVSGAGDLSGEKTDMAVNLYVPGCHLLCHDDVIGSRRVSYILYLTDPDIPWKAEWGGALRLYPTDDVETGDGKAFKLPRPDSVKTIPPAWNQLSFFAVQPGESFHDVQEVLKRGPDQDEDDGGRIRMAISGWYHIPQEGEPGFQPGLEEMLAEKSSLQQLQGKADELDEPQLQWLGPESRSEMTSDGKDDDELTEVDLQLLLKYMNPNYLTPDTVEELHELFEDESILQLTNFLNEKFANSLKTALEETPTFMNQFANSRPPHKHHYQYLHATSETASAEDPVLLLLNELFPSLAFQKWLSLVTGLTLLQCSVMARRFRKGLDYQLAQGYQSETPQLEYTLCVTPTTGWGGEGEETAKVPGSEDEDNVGGYELYMADDNPDEDDSGSNGADITAPNMQSYTGAGDRRSAKKQKIDPAVYRAAADDEDDGILFSNPPSWNTMSVVLRDAGTLKFVKYVSHAGPGDRFDFTGHVKVSEDLDEEHGED